MKEAQFAINGGQGFSITFENGVTVSVQFGPFHYCNNKDLNIDLTNYKKHDVPNDRYSCNNAEVAIFNDEGWLTKEYKDEGDDVLSHVNPDKVAKIIQWASNYSVKE